MFQRNGVALGVMLVSVLLVGCGLGISRPGQWEAPPPPSHPWLTDDHVEVPGENLAEARVVADIRDMARDAGIAPRSLLMEFRGTTRMVQEGEMAGFRALSFFASVAGDHQSVTAFLDKLQSGAAYPTLVVKDKQMSMTSGEASAALQFTVYTLPAR